MPRDRSFLIRYFVACAIAPFFSLTASKGALAGPLTVAVSNVPDHVGMIRVAVCKKDEFLKPHCAVVGKAPAVAGTVSVSFQDVPAGIYAVQTYQDRNDDGRLNKSFLGMPREPIGFSRDPKLRFGPPSFTQCAVQLTDAGGTIPVRLITHD